MHECYNFEVTRGWRRVKVIIAWLTVTSGEDETVVMLRHKRPHNSRDME